MDFRSALAGRRCLVTGASSGFGAHFAELLATCGARVALAARRTDELKAVERRCREAGAADTVAITLDVTEEQSIVDAVDAVEAAFGGLDLLVNNAGTSGSGGPALETPTEEFDGVLATNLRGAWLCATHAARRMAQREGGDIVNIASILGLRVAGGVVPYAISKAGLVQMTRGLALEWARHGIRVNALAPGYVETRLNRDFFASAAGEAMIRRIPMRRLGQLEDLEAPFLLLASGASAYLTAAVLTVDGGHHVSSL